MKKDYKKGWLRVGLCISTVAFSSCSDWTEPESLELTYTPTVSEQNPQLYDDYLKDLREYKSGEHNYMFVSFDNKAEEPTKQAERLIALPDSIDFVSLNHPELLNEALQTEMDKIREKGTRTLYRINCTVVDELWKNRIDEEGEDADLLTEADFLAIQTEYINKQLAFCDSYHFDGLIFFYPGQADISLSEAEKETYYARQTALFDMFATWKETHANKEFAYEGNPHYLNEASLALLAQCRFVLLTTEDCTDLGAMNLAGSRAVEALNGLTGEENIRLIMKVRLGDDKQDKGYFNTVNSEGKKMRAAQTTASWIRNDIDLSRKGGLFIMDAQTDYYGADHIYSNVRESIEIMNPSR